MEQMELTGEILPGIPVEVHPFPPFLPETARVLILGTFPPAAEKRPWILLSQFPERYVANPGNGVFF